MRSPERIGGVLVAGFFLATLVATAFFVPQPPDYFPFADRRTLLGIPNALDVLSNGGFALAGAWGLLSLVRRVELVDRRERIPWFVLFAGVALTSVGSAWFHLRPDDARLVWDRLPMTLGFSGLFAAILVERASVRLGLWALAPIAAVGAATVFYWRMSGNLAPYLVVQFYPLAAILLLLTLCPARYGRGVDLPIAIGWYLLAKVAEMNDERLFRALRLVSGHTLKHILATVGAGWLVGMILRRRPLA